jgi:hypothetical protein
MRQKSYPQAHEAQGRASGQQDAIHFGEHMSANNHQVGGSHYAAKAIQPWDYIASNNLGYFEGNIVKYVSRWRDKGGIEDLRKARHYLDKLIEVENGAR